MAEFKWQMLQLPWMSSVNRWATVRDCTSVCVHKAAAVRFPELRCRVDGSAPVVRSVVALERSWRWMAVDSALSCRAEGLEDVNDDEYDDETPLKGDTDRFFRIVFFTEEPTSRIDMFLRRFCKPSISIFPFVGVSQGAEA